MTAAIVILAAVAYAAGVLGSARYWYGLWRAWWIDTRPATRYHSYENRRVAVPAEEWTALWDDSYRPRVAVGAVATGLFWPLIAPVWAASLFASASKRKSGRELKAEAAAAKQRIAATKRRIEELEREAGMR